MAAYGVPLIVATRTGLVTALVAAGLGVLVARRDRLAAVVLAVLAVAWAGTALGVLGAARR